MVSLCNQVWTERLFCPQTTGGILPRLQYRTDEVLSFGLGYRRCPSELFNLFMLQNLLDKLNDYEFHVVPPNANLFELLSFGDTGFADGIPLGKDRARDNIFVDNIFGLD